jgi:hypothetical protein
MLHDSFIIKKTNQMFQFLSSIALVSWIFRKFISPFRTISDIILAYVLMLVTSTSGLVGKFCAIKFAMNKQRVHGLDCRQAFGMIVRN